MAIKRNSGGATLADLVASVASTPPKWSLQCATSPVAQLSKSTARRAQRSRIHPTIAIGTTLLIVKSNVVGNPCAVSFLPPARFPEASERTAAARVVDKRIVRRGDLGWPRENIYKGAVAVLRKGYDVCLDHRLSVLHTQ